MSVNSQGVGTTPIFYVPKDQSPVPSYQNGEFYFALKLLTGKIIYRGIGWWSNVASVAVVTTASVTGGTAPAISTQNINHAYRKSGGMQEEMISSGRNIINPIPATMDTASFTVQLVASHRDPVQSFLDLAESQGFATALDFSPGTSAVVNAIGTIVPGLIKVFQGDIPAQEPALDAGLDINLFAEPIKPGYYVVLAAMGTNTELPRLQSADQLQVQDNDLLLDGQPVQQASYLVLEIETAQNRGIEGSDELWVRLYNQTTSDLNDLIDGITPASNSANVLQSALKNIYTLTTLQEDNKTYTQPEKLFYRNKLTALYHQAATVGSGTGAPSHAVVSGPALAPTPDGIASALAPSGHE